MYEGNNINELKRISDKVLDQKLLRAQNSFLSIRHSLLLNAQIKLEDNTLSNDERNILNRFVKAGGIMDNSEDYTKISEITIN